METEINPKFNEDAPSVYKTAWKAYYKNGLANSTVVYGETIEEAISNALAEYRKSATMVDFKTANQVVDHVELIAQPIA